jgi:hypothetical protein
MCYQASKHKRATGQGGGGGGKPGLSCLVRCVCRYNPSMGRKGQFSCRVTAAQARGFARGYVDGGQSVASGAAFIGRTAAACLTWPSIPIVQRAIDRELDRGERRAAFSLTDALNGYDDLIARALGRFEYEVARKAMWDRCKLAGLVDTEGKGGGKGGGMRDLLACLSGRSMAGRRAVESSVLAKQGTPVPGTPPPPPPKVVAPGPGGSQCLDHPLPPDLPPSSTQSPPIPPPSGGGGGILDAIFDGGG